MPNTKFFEAIKSLQVEGYEESVLIKEGCLWFFSNKHPDLKPLIDPYLRQLFTLKLRSFTRTEKKIKAVSRADDDPTCFTFDEFYNMYNYKKDKQMALDSYRLLTEEQRESIKKTLHLYIRDTAVEGNDKVRRLYPSNYIQKGRWNDYEDILKAMSATIADPELEGQYVSYLTFIKKEFPSLVGSGLELTREEYTSYKQQSYHESAPSIGWTVAFSILLDAHKMSYRSKNNTIVFKNFLHLIVERSKR